MTKIYATNGSYVLWATYINSGESSDVHSADSLLIGIEENGTIMEGIGASIMTPKLTPNDTRTVHQRCADVFAAMDAALVKKFDAEAGDTPNPTPEPLTFGEECDSYFSNWALVSYKGGVRMGVR